MLLTRSLSHSVCYLKHEFGTRFKEIKIKLKDLATGDQNKNDDLHDGAADIQLFTAFFDVKSAIFTFNFSGIVNSYRVRQIGGLSHKSAALSGPPSQTSKIVRRISR